MLCGVCVAAHLKISAFSGIIKNTLGEWFFQPISTTSTYQGEVLICLQLEFVRESSGPFHTIMAVGKISFPVPSCMPNIDSATT